jgi:ubiquinone/menaquinone biosynthesis C-methylase UbiE
MTEAELYYDEKSKDYDKAFDMMVFKVYDTITWKYLEPYVPSDANAIVLDAAGGTGRWSIRIAKKGCKVVLLDLSEGMLSIAKQKVEKEGLHDRIIIEKGDIKKPNYPEGAFDMILCEHALFVLDDPDVALKEFARVLKKGAPLVISAQNLYVQLLMHLPCTEIPTSEKLQEVINVLERKKYDAMTNDGRVKIHTWTPDEFRNMLERNGFKVQKMVGKGMTMPLRITQDLYMKKDCSENLLNEVLQLELALSEKPDALALAGHLQAVAFKS